MVIQDETGSFSPDQLRELERFVKFDLLSTEVELDWLGKIIIRDDGRSGYGGYWYIKIITSPDNSNEIESVIAIIVLNSYVVKRLPSSIGLKELKGILAHEYGHHWTLSYLIVNQIIRDYSRDRLPTDYYEIRELNIQEYAPDYSKTWPKCDKEIIAEDYRYCFAPSPHNDDHQMQDQLSLPSEIVKQYIEGLKDSPNR